MPDITSLFVTRLYRAMLNELAKKKLDYAELRVTCETVAEDDEAPDWPRIDQPTADFTYARLMSSREDEPTGMTGPELDAVADQVRTWAKRGEVFAYFISGAKVRNPAAAQALIAKLK